MPLNFSWTPGEKKALRLFVSAEDTEFDPATLQHWKDEGFHVTFLSYNGDPAEYRTTLAKMGDKLDLGEKWALIAYSNAAKEALEICIKPVPKLATLICYYPTAYPKSKAGFPPSLKVQIHLASVQTLGTKFPAYTYERSLPGFAEEDLEEYDKVSARLAWTRALRAVREGFEVTVDLEKVWEDHVALEFVEKDADKTMATMVAEPYVNHVPTMTGGIGHRDLRRFYADYFIPSNPPSLKMRLLSRTIGTDRVVDEMHVSFRHTCEIPWLLPGVPPTDKFVEIALVSVVCIRGGKLYHEHIYWDQASVLLQVGLLDPKLIPRGFKVARGEKGKVVRLPVVGGEAARKVVDEEVGESNELIEGW